uniref:G_PROTEIN_RECEP_F1_2 domain-containing protein n=1 Tax=Panagrellus redivivus TaxID=6233 RepID=A0A7E4VN11_PANRE
MIPSSPAQLLEPTWLPCLFFDKTRSRDPTRLMLASIVGLFAIAARKTRKSRNLFALFKDPSPCAVQHFDDGGNFTDTDLRELSASSFGALSVPEHRPLWIADLVFYRTNRSVKYVQHGELLILEDVAAWSDVWPRLLTNFLFMFAFSMAICLNFGLFVVSLIKAKRKDHRKIQCLLANLAVCNILLALGFLIYSFLLDIYYDVDSFNTLLNLNSHSSFYQLWPFAKQLIHTELVDNMSLTQGFILLMISIDRYFALFHGYAPYVHRNVYAWAVAVFPYFLGLFVFDMALLGAVIGYQYAVVARLVAYMTPTPLSLVFTVCAVVRLVQQPPNIRHKHDDLSCSVTLLVILMLQLVEKFGIFLELLNRNFNFSIVIGDSEGDSVLAEVLWHIYQVSHYLILASPLYIPLFFLIFVGFYQSRVAAFARAIWRCLTCQPRVHLDYSTETMRSIMAEQSRNRQMKVV